MITFNRLAAAAVATFALTGTAFANPSAALIVDSTGVASAPATYSEVGAGTEIALGTGSLRFVHYKSCKEIEVLGGSLTISANDFAVQGGKVVSETAQPCPQQVKMSQATAVAGGLVMRGVMKMTEVADRPSLVLVGSKAATISSVKILEGGKAIAEMPVAEKRVVWASQMAPLKSGTTYTLALQSGEKTQIETAILVVDAAKAGVVVMRID